ncbi:U4/U6.U5 small nuclear ribonucleoprotein [Dispira simplex]|nr:U4/U6.U5 small nuclear ribonucleoprotein [Dispira simplex]
MTRSRSPNPTRQSQRRHPSRQSLSLTCLESGEYEQGELVSQHHGHQPRRRSPEERSPPRRRDIDRERSLRRRSRSRSPSRTRHRRRSPRASRRRSQSRSPPRTKTRLSEHSKPRSPTPTLPEQPLEMSEDAMMTIMGFGSFGTTQGQHIAGNDLSGVNVKKERRYRQYMNRPGGFNRPLDEK